MIVNGKKHKDFFVQKILIDKTFKNQSRLNLFLPLVKNKKVLHMGFVDWPITSPKNSLHLWLSEHCNKVDGYDVNKEGAENLRVPNGELYFDWNLIKDEYDIILIPEVLEHVDNVKSFFERLDQLSGKLVISAPDAYLLQNHFEETDNFIEVVHPDHNCYYSPFTLKNTIEKYSRRRVSSLHWVQNHSIVAVCE
jgi:hypothetical protein